VVGSLRLGHSSYRHAASARKAALPVRARCPDSSCAIHTAFGSRVTAVAVYAERSALPWAWTTRSVARTSVAIAAL